jgi:WD40 repeat protein
MSRTVRCPNPEGAEPLKHIGRFQIYDRLGTGAFGTVFLAFDPSLDREVALKVSRAGALQGTKEAEHFLREARAAARLQHPHIVPVYDAGNEGSHYYIASAYIHGQTLTEAVARGPLEPRRAARIVYELAEALAYAHSLGIIHRDVKPDNVILDHTDSAHLLDFGLARRQEDTGTLTQEGELLGTPAYMAPEQVEGRRRAIPASDQYSLGVILYELLCGHPPFEGGTDVVLAQIIHAAPPPLRQRRRRIPRDLETICLKALAKRPGDRYASCQELAHDLRRWLEDEPILARPLGRPERFVRWARRNPALVLSAFVGVVCLVAAAVVATLSARHLAELAGRETEARRAAEQAQRREAATRTRAEQAAQVAGEHLQAVAAQQAEAKRTLAEAEAAEAEARQALDKVQQEQARLQEAIAALEKEQKQKLAAERQAADEAQRLQQSRLRKEALPVFSVSLKGTCRSNLVVSPDDRYVLLGRGTDVFVLDISTRIPATLTVPAEPSNSAIGTSGRLSGQGGSGPITSVAVAANSGLVAASFDNGRVVAWDLPTRKLILSHRATPHRVHCLAFSPQKPQLASGSRDKKIILWDTKQNKQDGDPIDGLPGSVLALAFSADGQALAAGCSDGTILVYDLATRKPRVSFPYAGEPAQVAFLEGDSKRLAVFGAAAVKVWDTTAQRELRSLPGSRRTALSADGRRFASFDPPQLLIYDGLAGPELRRFSIAGSDILSMAFSKDGRQLATVDSYGVVAIWNAQPPDADETKPAAPLP